MSFKRRMLSQRSSVPLKPLSPLLKTQKHTSASRPRSSRRDGEIIKCHSNTRVKKKRHRTSQHLWQLKDQQKDFAVSWIILAKAKSYSGAPAAEGRQAEPHTHIRKLKGTHELIFSCVSWLAVLLVGAYARRRRRRRRWWSRATWRPQLTRKPKRGFSFRGLSL